MRILAARTQGPGAMDNLTAEQRQRLNAAKQGSGLQRKEVEGLTSQIAVLEEQLLNSEDRVSGSVCVCVSMGLE